LSTSGRGMPAEDETPKDSSAEDVLVVRRVLGVKMRGPLL